jgi:hypothetical protein
MLTQMTPWKGKNGRLTAKRMAVPEEWYTAACCSEVKDGALHTDGAALSLLSPEMVHEHFKRATALYVKDLWQDDEGELM